MVKIEGNKGITLIALIITIIVLLILAGVTINAITGNENVMEKAKEARELNELGEIKDMLSLSVNHILLESNAISVSDYYKDENSFITNGKISEDSYSIEDYEFENPIASGKITKINGLGIVYDFEIDILTNQVSVQRNQDEVLIESSGGYFAYSTADTNGNVKITGLTTSGVEAYDNNAEDIINLVIPKKSPAGNTINGIANNAFKDRNKIKKVVLQKEITSLGDGSFSNCTGLDEVKVPVSLNVNLAFRNVTSVTKVTFTPGIGESASYLNQTITPWHQTVNDLSVKIEKGVTSIGAHTFNNCTKLKSVSFPSTLTKVDDYAFNGCTNLTGDLGFVKNLTSIGSYSFCNCSNLTGEMTFSSEINTIPGRAFYGVGVTTLVIPQNIGTLGWQSFDSCSSMAELVLPITLNIYPNGASFAGCTSVKKVTFTPGNGDTVPSYITNFHKYTPWYLSCPANNSEDKLEIIIEEGVKSIGADTFKENKNISVSFPSTLETIGTGAFSSVTNATYTYNGSASDWGNVNKNNNNITNITFSNT